MLKNISWTDFIIVCFFLVSTYYLAVVLLFYRSRVRGLFRRKPYKQAQNDNVGTSSADRRPDEGSSPALSSDDFTATKEASDKLKVVINQAVSDGVERQDLLGAIRHHLEPYKRFEGTAFGVAIRNSITRELGHAGITLSAEELDAIWSSR